MKIRHEVIFQNEMFSWKDSGRSQSLKNQLIPFIFLDFLLGDCLNLAVHCSGYGFYWELGFIWREVSDVRWRMFGFYCKFVKYKVETWVI
jgi:hypothetical protein